MTGRLVAGLLVMAAVVCPQHRVDPKNTYNRVICVVPMVGKGTMDDPRRPLYAPLASTQPASQAKPGAVPRNAILAYSHQVSDDGNYALVKFVAVCVGYSVPASSSPIAACAYIAQRPPSGKYKTPALAS